MLIYPTISECLILWALFCAVAGFFIGYGKILAANVLVVFLIIAGFFLEIGAHIFNLIIK
jgi:hypothetical protein